MKGVVKMAPNSAKSYDFESVICWPWLGVDQIKFQSLGISRVAGTDSNNCWGNKQFFILIVWEGGNKFAITEKM